MEKQGHRDSILLERVCIFSLRMERWVKLLLLLLLLSSSSSSSSSLSSFLSCRVIILIFLRQTMSLWNTVLQLFCFYYSWFLYRLFQCWIYCNFTLVLSEVCVQCLIWLFSRVPWLQVFLVCCSYYYYRDLLFPPMIRGFFNYRTVGWTCSSKSWNRKHVEKFHWFPAPD